MTTSYFNSFQEKVSEELIPEGLNDPFGSEISELCKLAAQELQQLLLLSQDNLSHNFGFEQAEHESIRGKMFGVLVVQNSLGEIGYLYTCSGKIDKATSLQLVPSPFDIPENQNHLTKGMNNLTEIKTKIKVIEDSKDPLRQERVDELKLQRKELSHHLQNWIFDQYQFLNKNNEAKGLLDIFEQYNGRKPPAGAGECAAPKLLQHAFQNQLKPLSIAEFWWGKSNKSLGKIHGEFYPACNNKCRPILSHMLLP